MTTPKREPVKLTNEQAQALLSALDPTGWMCEEYMDFRRNWYVFTKMCRLNTPECSFTHAFLMTIHNHLKYDGLSERSKLYWHPSLEETRTDDDEIE